MSELLTAWLVKDTERLLTRVAGHIRNHGEESAKQAFAFSGSGFQILPDQVNTTGRFAQILNLAARAGLVEADISDSHAKIFVRFTAEAATKYATKHSQKFSATCTQGIINVIDYELRTSVHGDKAQRVYLLIKDFKYRGSKQPTVGRPKPILEFESVKRPSQFIHQRESRAIEIRPSSEAEMSSPVRSQTFAPQAGFQESLPSRSHNLSSGNFATQQVLPRPLTLQSSTISSRIGGVNAFGPTEARHKDHETTENDLLALLGNKITNVKYGNVSADDEDDNTGDYSDVKVLPGAVLQVASQELDSVPDSPSPAIPTNPPLHTVRPILEAHSNSGNFHFTRRLPRILRIPATQRKTLDLPSSWQRPRPGYSNPGLNVPRAVLISFKSIEDLGNNTRAKSQIRSPSREASVRLVENNDGDDGTESDVTSQSIEWSQSPPAPARFGMPTAATRVMLPPDSSLASTRASDATTPPDSISSSPPIYIENQHNARNEWLHTSLLLSDPDRERTQISKNVPRSVPSSQKGANPSPSLKWRESQPVGRLPQGSQISDPRISQAEPKPSPRVLVSATDVSSRTRQSDSGPGRFSSQSNTSVHARPKTDVHPGVNLEVVTEETQMSTPNLKRKLHEDEEQNTRKAPKVEYNSDDFGNPSRMVIERRRQWIEAREKQRVSLSEQNDNGKTGGLVKIFSVFKSSYPLYNGNQQHFERRCQALDKLLTSDSLDPHRWDAYIIRHKLEYSSYCVETTDAGGDIMSYEEFFKESVDGAGYDLRVLTPATLQQVVGGDGPQSGKAPAATPIQPGGIPMLHHMSKSIPTNRSTLGPPTPVVNRGEYERGVASPSQSSTIGRIVQVAGSPAVPPVHGRSWRDAASSSHRNSYRPNYSDYRDYRKPESDTPSHRGYRDYREPPPSSDHYGKSYTQESQRELPYIYDNWRSQGRRSPTRSSFGRRYDSYTPSHRNEARSGSELQSHGPSVAADSPPVANILTRPRTSTRSTLRHASLSKTPLKASPGQSEGVAHVVKVLVDSPTILNVNGTLNTTSMQGLPKKFRGLESNHELEATGDAKRKATASPEDLLVMPSIGNIVTPRQSELVSLPPKDKGKQLAWWQTDDTPFKQFVSQYSQLKALQGAFEKRCRINVLDWEIDGEGEDIDD